MRKSLAADIMGLHGRKVAKKDLRAVLGRLKEAAPGVELVKKLQKAVDAMTKNGIESARIELDPHIIDSTLMPETVSVSDLSGIYGIEVHPAELSGSEKGNANFFAEVSRRILEKIKVGTLPWRMPWNQEYQESEGSVQFANYQSNKNYRGMNFQMCLLFGGGDRYFLTEKQIQERGGKVTDRRRSVPICYFVRTFKDVQETVKEPDGSERTVSVKMLLQGLKWYKVYPLSATEGVKEIKRKPVKAAPKLEFQPIKMAEKIVASYIGKPQLRHAGNQAYYAPSSDTVTMPPKASFKGVPEYYSTLFHEYIHSTGHPKRLNRLKPATMGSKTYAAEELVAELGASFLCAVCRIDYYTLDNSAAYLKSWAKKLEQEIRADKQFFVRTQFAALKAAKLMMGGLWKSWNKGDLQTSGKEPVQMKLELQGISEEAKEALEYFREHLAGKKIRNDHKGTVIALPIKGGKHSISRNEWSVAQLYALKNIDTLIKTATFQEYQKHKSKNRMIVGVHIYRASAKIEGKWFDFRIVVKVQKRKNIEYYYYDHHEIIKKGSDKTVSHRDPKKGWQTARSITTSENKGTKSEPKNNLSGINVVSAEDLAAAEYQSLKLTGIWRKWLGEPAANFDLMLSGSPGGGKSTLLLQFAHYLVNDLKKKVLFVSKEEFGAATLADKVKRLEVKGVHFSNTINPDSKIQGDYDVVFIDSITALRFSIEDYLQLRELNPDVAFVLILQQTKGGVFKGANDWPHEVEIVTEVADGMALATKNRYSPNKETIKIPGYNVRKSSESAGA